MENYKIISGEKEDEIWSQVRSDLANIAYPFVYHANIRENDRIVSLTIEVDLGGGLESGFQYTSLTAPVPLQFTTMTSRLNQNKDFRFVLHDEDFIDKVGKFFGMEDVQIGYPEFDKKLIVKTNNSEKVKEIFADDQTRKLFETLGSFNMHISHYDHEDKHSILELTIDRDITNAEELHKIYNVFIHVLNSFEYNSNPV